MHIHIPRNQIPPDYFSLAEFRLTPASAEQAKKGFTRRHNPLECAGNFYQKRMIC